MIKPFTFEDIVINNQKRIIVKIQNFNYLIKTDDYIKISNSLATDNIPSKILNNTHKVYKKRNNTIFILLPFLIN